MTVNLHTISPGDTVTRIFAGDTEPTTATITAITRSNLSNHNYIDQTITRYDISFDNNRTIYHVRPNDPIPGAIEVNMQIRYHVFASDKVANDRTSDNVAEWSDYQNPMTKDELLADLDQHDATDIDWYTDTELLVTWTNPFNGERERIFFFMERA